MHFQISSELKSALNMVTLCALNLWTCFCRKIFLFSDNSDLDLCREFNIIFVPIFDNLLLEVVISVYVVVVTGLIGVHQTHGRVHPN